MGASSWPSRVLKGLRMAGRMGGERVKTRNLAIAKIMADKNLLFIEGSVPGHNNSFVLIEKY
jgi:large subunit ribosomal protein L3